MASSEAEVVPMFEGGQTATEAADSPEHHIVSGTFHVPGALDQDGRERLHALSAIREGSDWATAATVYAWTEPDQGRRSDLLENSKKFTLSQFADLGFRGLKSFKTVRKYRRAWETAVEKGWAQEARRGQPVDLPDREFATADQPHNTQSKSNEWYTPAKYIEAAREVMGGIDLDPASCLQANETVQADTFYTAAEDGLDQGWFGRVWMNPPWGDRGPKFVQRLVTEYEKGRIEQAVLLVNAHSTETEWFRPLWDHVLCFTDHRIDYDSPEEKTSTSTHGSVFIYLGDREDLFADTFCEFGTVVRKWVP